MNTTQQVYAATVRGRIRRGWNRGLAVLRRVVGRIPAHSVSSLMYHALALALTYLELTVPSSVTFGLRVMDVPWQGVVILFTLCGAVLAQRRIVEVYLVCHVPAFLYMLAVAWGTFVGGISSLGMLSVIYLTYGVLTAMISVATQDQLRVQRNQVELLQEKVSQWTSDSSNDSSTT
jgi:hypothetical protein